MAKKFQFKIISVDGKVYTDQIQELDITTTGGNIGILAGHFPLVAMIDVTCFKIKNDDGIKYFSISGGVLNVENESTYILADTFEESSELDKERILRAKARAEEVIKNLSINQGSFERQAAEFSLRKALNRLSLIK